MALESNSIYTIPIKDKLYNSKRKGLEYNLYDNGSKIFKTDLKGN